MVHGRRKTHPVLRSCELPKHRPPVDVEETHGPRTLSPARNTTEVMTVDNRKGGNSSCELCDKAVAALCTWTPA